jgi:hypothetical protein
MKVKIQKKNAGSEQMEVEVVDDIEAQKMLFML